MNTQEDSAWGVAPFLTEDQAQAADALYEETEAAIKVASDDQGEEAVEGGGWVDVVRAIVDMSDASPVVKGNVLRRHGLPNRTPRPVAKLHSSDELADYLAECLESAGKPWEL